MIVGGEVCLELPAGGEEVLFKVFYSRKISGRGIGQAGIFVLFWGRWCLRLRIEVKRGELDPES